MKIIQLKYCKFNRQHNTTKSTTYKKNNCSDIKISASTHSMKIQVQCWVGAVQRMAWSLIQEIQQDWMQELNRDNRIAQCSNQIAVSNLLEIHIWCSLKFNQIKEEVSSLTFKICFNLHAEWSLNHLLTNLNNEFKLKVASGIKTL